ncbi:MAG: hypothetical protein V1887_00725 [Candidatus Aenigmatarchaeota archaeon]
MLHLFIKGKNPELSSAELRSMVNGKLVDSTDSFDVYEIEKPPAAAQLGGTLKIAAVKAEIPAGSDAGELEAAAGRAIPENTPKKMLFGVSVYPLKLPAYRTQKAVGMAVKHALKEKGTKAAFMGFPKQRIVPELTNVEVIKRGLVKDGFELLVCESETRIYFALTTDVHDPFEFQKRDTGRPVQRTIFSIPPRLARTMVNLALEGRNGTLLDPFCGIGTILQEAALGGADIRGTDIDAEAIKGCLTNLKWLEKENTLEIEEPEKKMFRWDAAELFKVFANGSIDAIATEPYLGPPLKKPPEEQEAEKLVNELTAFYEKMLPSIRDTLKPGGKMAIVIPAIRTAEGGEMAVDARALAEKNGMEILGIYKDAEPRHLTVRLITVLKKSA